MIEASVSINDLGLTSGRWEMDGGPAGSDVSSFNLCGSPLTMLVPLAD